MNFHLANSVNYQTSAAKGKKITNFSNDIKDSIAYACLLEQIQPVDEDTKEYELMPPINANLITKVMLSVEILSYLQLKEIKNSRFMKSSCLIVSNIVISWFSFSLVATLYNL